MSQICKTCKVEKPLKDFSLDRNRIKVVCRKCCTKKQTEFIRTKYGMIRQIYQQQKQKSIKRGHKPPEYDFESFYDWFIKNENFDSLFNIWVKSGYKTDMKPSVDRIKNEVGYSFDNIRLVTWYENNHKEFDNKLNGINTKYNKAVKQFTLEGTYIQTFYSIRHASRVLNCLHSGIMRCCKGRQKYAYGFKWEYE